MEASLATTADYVGLGVLARPWSLLSINRRHSCWDGNNCHGSAVIVTGYVVSRTMSADLLHSSLHSCPVSTFVFLLLMDGTGTPGPNKTLLLRSTQGQKWLPNAVHTMDDFEAIVLTASDARLMSLVVCTPYIHLVEPFLRKNKWRVRGKLGW